MNRSQSPFNLELPRGMKDFEEIELAKIELIRQKFLETSKLFGFKFMDPSPIESIETLEVKSGPAIRDEIYFFKDKADREIALRFDFTVGITRWVISQKSLKLPAKISSFGGVFRYDEPQKGRYRFFHQWNIEIFGKPSIESESEIVEFTAKMFENLGFKDIILELNNRKLVESYINKVFQSTDQELILDIFRAVDKIQKKSKEDILQEYGKKGYSADKLEQILKFSQTKGTPEEIEKTIDTTQLDSWNDLKELWASLNNRGVTNIRINFGVVRGLDYYSGMVFEVFDKNSDLGALAGGGRYDSLTHALGRDDIGATGVAGGVERMILIMDQQGITDGEKQPTISVVYVNEETQKYAMNLASKLRQQNIPVDVDLVGKSLSKQMEAASNSTYCVIVGPKELAEDSILLRNMKDGSENKVHIKNLLADPKTILKT